MRNTPAPETADESGATSRRAAPRRRRRLAPSIGWALMVAAAAAIIAVTGSPEPVGGLAPPADRFAHGAAGTGRNGVGGAIGPSPTSPSWPGTGVDRSGRANGGPFAFVGAQYGSLWRIPPQPNNSRGVGYCVMEDVRGRGTVTKRADPAAWSAGEMARAAALMATYGGDRMVPYGLTDAFGPIGRTTSSTTSSTTSVGTYDVATGEWRHPALWGGGEYTRRRHVAVNFGVRMFVEDVSPFGSASGRKLARDTSVIGGSGGDFAALRNGYRIAQRMADVADIQHAVGGVQLTLAWRTPDGAPPAGPGTYPLEVRSVDGTGKPVGFVPIIQLSGVGIGDARSTAAVARVDNRNDTTADRSRWSAAAATGWPTWRLDLRLARDERFAVGSNALAADVADHRGVARFDVEITEPDWELAFHVQAPTANVDLYAGSGVQGQITWSGRPQSASVHHVHEVPDVHVAVAKSSTDAGVGVAGTVFALVDASRDEVGRATVGTDGRAVFEPFSPVEFEPPHALVELVAAPGLERLTADVPVPADLSTDPERPTVVPVRNRAITATFVVRKVLDDAGVQGRRDMSGFVFEVTQIATGRSLGRFTTAADGVTRPIRAVRGEHRVVEVARPPWARGLVDAGAVSVQFDPTAGDATEVVYVNLVPEATIDTAARDAADGDRLVDLALGDAAVIDTVSYCGLVPGTSYTATAELQVRIHAGAATGPSASVEPTGLQGHTTFTPDDACGSIDVRIDVPADSVVAGHRAVVFQRVTFAADSAGAASTGAARTGTASTNPARTVAEHVDPDDADQTVEVVAAPPPTTAPSATPPTTTPSATTSPTTTPPTTTPSTATSPTATPPTTTPPTTTSAPVDAPDAATTTTTTTTTTDGSTTTVASTARPAEPTVPVTTSTEPQRAATLPRTGGGSGAVAWIASILALTGVAIVLNIIRPDADQQV